MNLNEALNKVRNELHVSDNNIQIFDDGYFKLDELKSMIPTETLESFNIRDISYTYDARTDNCSTTISMDCKHALNDLYYDISITQKEKQAILSGSSWRCHYGNHHYVLKKNTNNHIFIIDTNDVYSVSDIVEVDTMGTCTIIESIC